MGFMRPCLLKDEDLSSNPGNPRKKPHMVSYTCKLSAVDGEGRQEDHGGLLAASSTPSSVETLCPNRLPTGQLLPRQSLETLPK